jgi:hypothetical protein
VSEIQKIAKQYIEAGWSVVPLVPGEKKANTSWQKRTYKPEDFNPNDGIAGKCGEPSGWRVDVDCDAAEAVIAAKMLLPATGLIHGRPGKPDSHYWYICAGIKTTQFTDIKGADGKTSMLIEIRSTGGYTALPPSGHPSGDVLAWSLERPPMSLAEDVMYEAVRNVAIAALVGRHYPDSGARHKMVGDLAGFLLQASVEPHMVTQIIKTAATFAQDADLSDRVKYVQATCGKFKAGEKVTGGPKLEDSLGQAVVAKLRAWLRVADLDAIESMNAKHFFVRLGKDSAIGREDDEDEVVFQRTSALSVEYANRLVQVGTDKNGEGVFKPLFDQWLKSSSRRSYRKVVFAPPPLPTNTLDFNLWKGFAIEAKRGNCHQFLSHVRHIICNNDPEHYEYFMNLLALTVQQPGTPSEVATVLRGDPGVGKGIVFRALGDLFGPRHYAHLDKPDQVLGHFNALLAGKVIVFMDEAFWAGDKREIGALKRLITEPTLTIEPKGIDPFSVRNVAHVFMATNNDWSIPAELKDRRFFALKASDAQRGNSKYFRALSSELQSGGLSALLWLLQNRDITDFDHRAVPKTDELRIQQLLSLAPELEWLFDCVYAREFGAHGWPTGWFPIANVYDHYETWCRDHRKVPLSKVAFGQRMAKHLWVDGDTKNRTVTGKDVRCGRLKPLGEVRKALLSESVPPMQQPLFDDAQLVLERGDDGRWHPRWIEVTTD